MPEFKEFRLAIVAFYDIISEVVIKTQIGEECETKNHLRCLHRRKNPSIFTSSS